DNRRDSTHAGSTSTVTISALSHYARHPRTILPERAGVPSNQTDARHPDDADEHRQPHRTIDHLIGTLNDDTPRGHRHAQRRSTAEYAAQCAHNHQPVEGCEID
ncbi:MAG: hypothetical protein WBG14_05640, partial [Rhodococcus sp. (in: high G+C Gram-positive bacteria)]